LQCVSQKKKNKIMVTDFIDSVLIIDDKEEEVKALQKVLEDEDICVQFINPTGKKATDLPVLKKNRDLIFMDLSLDDDEKMIGNISKIRKILLNILPKNKGCYGLVVWSKHIDDIDILKKKLLKDKEEYTLPMFIVPFDKTDYLQRGYGNILNDLNNVLTSDKLAYFFLSWRSSVQIAADSAIFDIYSLVPEYENQQKELIYLMYKMALNHTGIPVDHIENYDLTTDAYKAFDELLYSDLINQQNKNSINIFKPTPQNPYNNADNKKNEIFSKLNSKMFIDKVNIQQDYIIPGNVYEIIGQNLVRPKLPNKVKDVEKYIAIELTPPCDFSQKKKINSRLIKGFLCDITHKEKFKNEFYYKDMFPLAIEENNNLQLVLDFRYFETVEDSVLKDENKYKVLFRVSPKLFADILQKFSSSYARLGLSKIE